MAKNPKKRASDAEIDNDPMFATTRNEANARLRLYIDRILWLEEEKKGVADDIKDVYTELKSSGYDGTTVRRMVRLSKMEKDARDEMLALEALYRDELGF